MTHLPMVLPVRHARREPTHGDVASQTSGALGPSWWRCRTRTRRKPLFTQARSKGAPGGRWTRHCGERHL